jgi:poly(A) polymerase
MIPDRLQAVLTEDVLSLAAAFDEAGHPLYLVGGSVRDAMLDRILPEGMNTDRDFTTSAMPDEIERIGSEWASTVFLAGKEFGTIGLAHKGQTYEVTTYRSEMYRDESRKPAVTFGSSLSDDLSRRDFTVNAMALKVPASAGATPEMVDPHNGLEDLVARVLRTPRPPETLFDDDPLRMLRLFRFVSTLGFTPDPAALEAVADMRGRLSIISAERIRTEFDKLMTGDNVTVALELLIDSGLAVEFIPEIPALAVEQDPVHRHKDVLAHTIAVVGKTHPRLRLRLAALFHDIGKPATREYAKGGISFHHHEVVGARMTRRRMKELRYPKDLTEETANLVFLHMRPHTFKMGWTDAAVRRYVRDAGPLLEDLNELVRSDVTTRNARRARTISRRIDELEERIVELRQREELDALRPPIDGNDVMQYLDLKPSRTVGDIMDMLLERRIEDGPYSVEEAYGFLDTWRDSQSNG